MSVVSNGSIRMNSLAAATALALSLVAAPAFAGRADLSGLKSAEQFDQFIVKYKDGSAAKRDIAALNLGLQEAAGRLQADKGRSVQVMHKRKMSMGLDVVRTDRKLSRAEADALMPRR
jgi:serine protease